MMGFELFAHAACGRPAHLQVEMFGMGAFTISHGSIQEGKVGALMFNSRGAKGKSLFSCLPAKHKCFTDEACDMFTCISWGHFTGVGGCGEALSSYARHAHAAWVEERNLYGLGITHYRHYR